MFRCGLMVFASLRGTGLSCSRAAAPVRAAAVALRARQIQSRLFARGLAIRLLRRLKLHRSKMLGNPKPVPYLPSCGRISYTP